MTRAPKSANCRVVNGAATACSSDTTVITSRGSINKTGASPERAPPDSLGLSLWKWEQLDRAASRGTSVRCRTPRQIRTRRTSVRHNSLTPKKHPPTAASRCCLPAHRLSRHRKNSRREPPAAAPPLGSRMPARSEIESLDSCRLAGQKRRAHSHNDKRDPKTSARLLYTPKQSGCARQSNCPGGSVSPALPRQPGFPPALLDCQKTIPSWRGSSSSGLGESSIRVQPPVADPRESWIALRFVS